MGWLPWPVLPKRRWPAIRYREKRAITREEHELILSRESNPEMRAFLLVLLAHWRLAKRRGAPEGGGH